MSPKHENGLKTASLASPPSYSAFVIPIFAVTSSCGHLRHTWAASRARARGLRLTPGPAPGGIFTPAGGSLLAGCPLCGGFPFMLFDNCAAARKPSASVPKLLYPRAPSPRGRALRRHALMHRGRPAGSSIGDCVSDFALAPLRGLDVQTSPERAEREGPARGRRRREAPQLKGAGPAPPLGRTRGRKEGAGPPGPARGCERPQGGQPEKQGCGLGLPAAGCRGGARGWGEGCSRSRPLRRVLPAEASKRPSAAVAGPLLRGARETKAKASRRRGLCARSWGWLGRRRAGVGVGGLGGLRALSARPTRPAARACRRNYPAPP